MNYAARRGPQLRQLGLNSFSNATKKLDVKSNPRPRLSRSSGFGAGYVDSIGDDWNFPRRENYHNEAFGTKMKI